MSSERREKIGLLSRASKGKLILPNYLTNLSFVIGSEVTPPMLTDLKERDLLLEDFRKGYKEGKASAANTFSKTYTAENKDTVFTVTSCFAGRLDEPVFLLTKESETCGAVHMEGRLLLRHCSAILDIDGDAVMVLSKDHGQGLFLDYAPDDPEFCYELTVWGHTWPLIVMGCSR